MGEVLLHAGSPKCGSSAIQHWLATNHRALGADVGLHLVHAPQAAELTVFEPESGPANCAGPILAIIAGQRSGDADPVHAFCAQLDRLASERGRIIVSHELMWSVLGTAGDAFAAGLERLAGTHRVRLVAYVRGQHELLESFWRMRGFLSPATPEEWVLATSAELHFDRLVSAFRAAMPSVEFDIRRVPVEGVISDFSVAVGAAAEPVPSPPFVANVGLPLDLAILLRGVPANYFSAGEAGSAMEVRPRQWRLAALAAQWDVTASPAARESQQILQAFAHQTYAEGNERLAQAMAWSGGPIVEPPATPPASLDALNTLWEPDVSQPAVQYLRHVIDALLATTP